MRRFEYDITIHPAEAFQQLVYICTADGECQEEPAPTSNVAGRLVEIMNARGRDGWELVEVKASSRAIVTFWKREVG
jgi:hypothetical protein